MNDQERHAESALHCTAWSGDLGEIGALVAADADVNWIDSGGETALFGAAAWGRAEVVCCLLEAGPRHDLRECSGYTPLHWAASHGNLATLEVLVLAGADTAAADDAGRLPVDVANSKGKGPHVAYLKKAGPPIASRRRQAGA